MKTYFEELNAKQMRKDKWSDLFWRHRPIFEAAGIIAVVLVAVALVDPVMTAVEFMEAGNE